MSELSDSNCQYFNLLFSDLIRLCSFILSHPLYFSYFIFFSPYLIKLISFLSPLFITTFLVFTAFLAGFAHIESSQTPFASILEKLQFNKDFPNDEEFKQDSPNEEHPLPDDLGIYETVFGSSPPMAAVSEHEDLGENKVHPKPPNPCVVMEEKRLQNFFKILDEFERLASNVEEIKRKMEPPSSKDAKSNDIGDESSSLSPMAKSESQRITSSVPDHHPRDVAGDDGKLKVRAESYSSMRREKEREWERTLASKLVEERRNVGGGEGMDSLWEAYEMEEICKVGRRKKEKMRREKMVEREWEGEEIGVQPCCLQALKLSAGKVMLGVGKPNLVKISKAIKGFGWLHKTTKNSKKVHNHKF